MSYNISPSGIYLSAYKSTPQNVLDSTQTNVTFDTITFSNGITSSGSGAYFTVNSPGIYMCNAQLYYAGNASGYREIDHYEGTAGARDTAIQANYQTPVNGIGFFILSTCLHKIITPSSQTISIWTWNTSGSTLAINGTAITQTIINIYKISNI